jgi:hypothetical protein
MKHLRLYENFEDDVPGEMRDLFGLEDEFVINFMEPYWGGDREAEYCRIKGPSENFDDAEEIVDDFKEEIERTKENMSSDGEYLGEIEIEDILFGSGYYDRLSALGYHVYYDGKKFEHPVEAED